MDPDPIDTLLERYLHLLDEYASLRGELSALQAGIYQDIARANFAAERGLRFGRDHYDERMQATRRLAVALDDRGIPRFTAITTGREQEEDGGEGAGASSSRSEEAQTPAPETSSSSSASGGSKDAPPGGVVTKGTPAPAPAPTTTAAAADSSPPNQPPPPPPTSPQRETDDSRHGSVKPRQRDPLSWFGLLAPSPLRSARDRSAAAVERVVPRLASVGAEMAQVEIEVRRARKRRAKAEAVAAAAAGREREKEKGKEGEEGRQQLKGGEVVAA